MSSPPYRWPCFYGMDTGTRGELLAANMDVEEIRTYLDVDSLSYLNLDRLIEATGASGADQCLAVRVVPGAVPSVRLVHGVQVVELAALEQLPAMAARVVGS